MSSRTANHDLLTAFHTMYRIVMASGKLEDVRARCIVTNRPFDIRLTVQQTSLPRINARMQL